MCKLPMLGLETLDTLIPSTRLAGLLPWSAMSHIYLCERLRDHLRDLLC